jgi:hypothetical protein
MTFKKENEMKARITLTATMDYEVDPTLYPEGLTCEDMINCDVTSYTDDPMMLLDVCDKVKVSATLLNAQDHQTSGHASSVDPVVEEES